MIKTSGIPDRSAGFVCFILNEFTIHFTVSVKKIFQKYEYENMLKKNDIHLIVVREYYFVLKLISSKWNIISGCD